MNNPNLHINQSAGKFPKVKLRDPVDSAFILVGLEIDHRLPFAYFIESRNKRDAIAALKRAASDIGKADGVIEATVFKTLIAPPGRGAYLKNRPEVPIARYDLVMLVELDTVQAAQELRQNDIWNAVEKASSQYARKSLVLNARNSRSMGKVDHNRDGVFLFNYFYADDVEQNLAVWEYTAGWFSDQTGLDNSCLLQPAAGEASDYTVINHCRWDRLSEILPAILFKRSFRTYVMRNFEENNIAPIPILYKLA